MSTLHSQRSSQEGFTMLELTIVILLMGILVIVIVPNLMGIRDNVDDDTKIAVMSEISAALEEYKLACGEYPRIQSGISGLYSAANNGCPTGDFAVTLADFITPPAAVAYEYVPLTVVSGSGICHGYHLAVTLADSSSSLLAIDDDFTSSSSAGSAPFHCTPGAHETLDGTVSNVYDLVIPKSIQ